MLSIPTNWEIDRRMLCFQKASKKGERLNALAFHYHCLKDVEETLLFSFSALYKVLFSNGFGPVRATFKITVTISYS